MLKTREDYVKAEQKVDQFLEVIGRGYKTSIGNVDFNWSAIGGPRMWLANGKLHRVLRLEQRFWEFTEFVVKEEDLRRCHKWAILTNIKAHWYDELSKRGKWCVKQICTGKISIYQLSSSQLECLDIPFGYTKPTAEQIQNDLVDDYNGEWVWNLKRKEDAKKEMKMKMAREKLAKQLQLPIVSYKPMSMDELENLCMKS